VTGESHDVDLCRRLAAAVAWIGHPLVFISLAVAVVSVRLAIGLVSRFAHAVGLRGAPMRLLLFRGVRSAMSDADVSERTERTRLSAAIPISAIGGGGHFGYARAGLYLRRSDFDTGLLVLQPPEFPHQLHCTRFLHFTAVVFFSCYLPSPAQSRVLSLFWCFGSRLYCSGHDLPEC